MFDLMAELLKQDAGGNGGLAESECSCGVEVAEKWRKSGGKLGANGCDPEIRHFPPEVAENYTHIKQPLTCKSANPPNPPPREVAIINPSTPPPISEPAILLAMERAVVGLQILPSEFRADIADDEAGWCATGRIPIKTARAFARLFAQERARDPKHPTRYGQVTCWACANWRGKRCTLRHGGHERLWFRCDDYRGGM